MRNCRGKEVDYNNLLPSKVSEYLLLSLVASVLHVRLWAQKHSDIHVSSTDPNYIEIPKTFMSLKQGLITQVS